MKVAFIEPAIANVEPLGIGYLIQMLVNEGHTVKYFESPRTNFIKRLKEFNPDILAYSITTGKHRLCRELNNIIRKEIKAISLFGGPHCTFNPEFIESSSLIDGICRGEGEFAILDLLKKIENNKDYTKTDNWWLRINGKIYKNPVRYKIENLDSLPFPNREIIYAENKGLSKTPIKRIIASRGCPFNCSYCFNRIYNFIYKEKGKIHYHRSTSNIIEDDINLTYPKDILNANMIELKRIGETKIIGKDSDIKDENKVINSVIGDNVVIKEKIRIMNSVILSDCIVTSDKDLNNTVASPEVIVDCSNP